MEGLTRFGKVLKHGWQDVAQGWRDLTHRASSALTRFLPRTTDQRDTGGTDFPVWGLLAGEVLERGDAVIVQLELPGLRRGDCEVTVQDGFLRVTGEKQSDREYLGANYHLKERAYGSFERTVQLPSDVDPDSGRAALRDGVLKIEFRKEKKGAARRQHRIEVK